MRAERLVQRQGQRARLKELEDKVKTYRPFLEAQKVLDDVYKKGVEAGRKQVMEALAAKDTPTVQTGG